MKIPVKPVGMGMTLLFFLFAITLVPDFYAKSEKENMAKNDIIMSEKIGIKIQQEP